MQRVPVWPLSMPWFSPWCFPCSVSPALAHVLRDGRRMEQPCTGSARSVRWREASHWALRRDCTVEPLPFGITPSLSAVHFQAEDLGAWAPRPPPMHHAHNLTRHSAGARRTSRDRVVKTRPRSDYRTIASHGWHARNQPSFPSIHAPHYYQPRQRALLAILRRWIKPGTDKQTRQRQRESSRDRTAAAERSRKPRDRSATTSVTAPSSVRSLWGY